MVIAAKTNAVLEFTSRDRDNPNRVLVLAPHPDDEALACGGLIQTALMAGAAVRVIFATDGDNNPWPQRWIERRWHIGFKERARWGARRRAEAKMSLQRLGVAESATRFLGWPDQGLTAALLNSTQFKNVLAAEIDGYKPSHIVLPALSDRHPDHSATRIFVELALELVSTATDSRPALLEYLVHGSRVADTSSFIINLDEVVMRHKREAVLEHRSQVTLSQNRLLAHVRPHEYFRCPDSAIAAASHDMTLPWHIAPALHRWFSLWVVHAGGAVCLPLTQALSAQASGGTLTIKPQASTGPVFFKLQTRIRSPWIFDYWGWCRFGAGSGSPIHATDLIQ